jgi:hypothetical protein
VEQGQASHGAVSLSANSASPEILVIARTFDGEDEPPAKRFAMCGRARIGPESFSLQPGLLLPSCRERFCGRLATRMLGAERGVFWNPAIGGIMESWLMDLIVQGVAGAAGGVGAGSVLKDLSMGKPADAVTGAVGGGIVGQILSTMLGGGGDVAGMDVGSLVRDIVGGGVGGAVVMALIGALRNAMMKR